MANRDNGTKRKSGGTTTTNASGAMTANAMERRVVAFAEQIGRMTWTVQAKAEAGWTATRRTSRSPVCVMGRTCSNNSRRRDEGLEEDPGRGGARK
jgi:hypothetical protein